MVNKIEFSLECILSMLLFNGTVWYVSFHIFVVFQLWFLNQRDLCNVIIIIWILRSELSPSFEFIIIDIVILTGKNPKESKNMVNTSDRYQAFFNCKMCGHSYILFNPKQNQVCRCPKCNTINQAFKEVSLVK